MASDDAAVADDDAALADDAPALAHDDATLAHDAAVAAQPQDASSTVDTGSEPSDASADACASAADACAATGLPKAPDCKTAPCTGELRWQKRLTDVSSAEPPRVYFRDVLADRGVFAFVEGGRDTRLDGVALLEGAQFDRATKRATSVIRLDANGTLIDHRVLPPALRATGDVDVRYFAGGHAESMVVIDEFVELESTRSLAWVQGTPGLSNYEYPEGAKQITLGRDRWIGFSPNAGAEPALCAGGSGALTRFEHTDLSGQRALSRACVRTLGYVSSSIWALPSGGLAALVSTYLEDAQPPATVRSDFGAGPMQLATNKAHLVVWNADGSPRFVRPLVRSAGFAYVGGADDVWVVETTARPQAPYRSFDGQGMLRGEGMTPENSSYMTMRIDAAGHALFVGAGPSAETGMLRKLSGQGELLWERPVDPKPNVEFATDAAGNIYLASQSGVISQFAP